MTKKRENTRKNKFIKYKWINGPEIKVPFTVEGTKGNVRSVEDAVHYIRRALGEMKLDVHVSFSLYNLDGMMYIPQRNLYIDILSPTEYVRFDSGGVASNSGGDRSNHIKILDTTACHNCPHLMSIIRNLVDSLPDMSTRMSNEVSNDKGLTCKSNVRVEHKEWEF